MVLPLLKLGTLALKTLSKPIAGRFKNYAAVHPRFRNYIVSIAQANHRITTTMQRRLYGHATDVEIRPLNEEKAVQAAVDLLGDVFVFTVAVIALIFEVQRNSRAEAQKEEKRRQDLEGLRQEVELLKQKRGEDLAKEVELFKQKLAEDLAKEVEIFKQKLTEDLKKEVGLIKLQFAEIEQLAKKRGLTGAFNFRQHINTEEPKPTPPAA